MFNLSDYNNSWYNPGSKFKLIFWYFIHRFFFATSIPWPNFVKIKILRSFGAKVGNGVVIKPNVNIKYPWYLSIGSYTWIGEKVWIDCLDEVKIGSNCCISQDVYLLTGNHNYKENTFNLIIKPINIADGVWVCAKSVICPGVMIDQNVVVLVGSVATGHLKENSIYRGNPAVYIKDKY